MKRAKELQDSGQNWNYILILYVNGTSSLDEVIFISGEWIWWSVASVYHYMVVVIFSVLPWSLCFASAVHFICYHEQLLLYWKCSKICKFRIPKFKGSLLSPITSKYTTTYNPMKAACWKKDYSMLGIYIYIYYAVLLTNPWLFLLHLHNFPLNVFLQGYICYETSDCMHSCSV